MGKQHVCTASYGHAAREQAVSTNRQVWRAVLCRRARVRRLRSCASSRTVICSHAVRRLARPPQHCVVGPAVSAAAVATQRRFGRKRWPRIIPRRGLGGLIVDWGLDCGLSGTWVRPTAVLATVTGASRQLRRAEPECGPSARSAVCGCGHERVESTRDDDRMTTHRRGSG